MNRTIRCAAAAALCAVLVAGCSHGSDGSSPGAGQFTSRSSTTTTVAGPGSPTSTSAAPSPSTPEEFSEAEQSNSVDEGGWVTGAVDKLDLSDPEQAALGWGCALRSKPAGESSEAWALRLAGPLTARARTKLDSISSPADPSTRKAKPIGAYSEVDGAKTQRWRVDCEVVTFAPGGERVSYDSTTPVRVVLVNEGGRWLVDDFGWGGIDLAT
jgi:hypothetical protein